LFYKRQEISWPAERLLSSEGGLNFMQFVRYYYYCGEKHRTHWIGDWVRYRTGTVVVEKKEYLAPWN
jgi:hypothetical protein